VVAEFEVISRRRDGLELVEDGREMRGVLKEEVHRPCHRMCGGVPTYNDQPS